MVVLASSRREWHPDRQLCNSEMVKPIKDALSRRRGTETGKNYMRMSGSNRERVDPR